MRPRNNKYFGAFFSHRACLLCFIWEHDEENDEGRVRKRDNNEKKGIVVDENQGSLLPLYYLFCLTKRLHCLADTSFVTVVYSLLLKHQGV